MGAGWKTISIFISSTFRDMHAERDQLNRVVFPALEERLKGRRCRLEPIDLRVGVETDSTQTERERELQILKVCLAEIERSRPFLLVLLGDRYGWVPGEDRIKAAASEAGFGPGDERASVTALEIEYGLLQKDSVQRRRCLLCLREPLPYDRMPPDRAAIYSDEHGTDPDAPERARRLKLLKAKINNDPQLAPHRFPYRLDWGDQAYHPHEEGVEGLAAWGRKVEGELWKLLDAETQHLVNQAEPTWEEEERLAIEEMVERLNGSFVGRTGLVQQALDLALSSVAQASSPASSTGVPPAGTGTGGTPGPLAAGTAALRSWGLCFTGGSGSGKSALFARLHHQLSTLNSQPSILLLSHAAGISPRAGLTGSMLRRWVGELAAPLGEAAPAIPEDIKPEELEKLFGQWLARAAATRRVVVLVDALNQFLRTERARTVSWLPALWPANARFIATTIAGEESQRLGQRPGVNLCEVPPLSAAEADAITAQVHARYHREPNKEVVAALLAKRLPDGAPAAGNPLWLTLALDLLNLLDADDFTAAEAAAGGTPEQRLRRMLLDRAHALPPTVEALYGHLLAHIEKVVSVAEARAFAALIALSRHGWREEDLQHLLPKAAELLATSQASVPQPSTLNPQPPAWDPLRFAILRRCFRAHLVKRGALEQWDFAHATLRQAIQGRLRGEWQAGRTADLTRVLYGCGAGYLETLPSESAIRENELMWQMLGTRNALRVASYYVQPATGSRLLALFLAEDEAAEGHPLRQFVLSLAEVGENGLRAAVANRFNFDLNDALEVDGHLPLRKELLEAAQRALALLAAADPSKAVWQHELAASQDGMGNVLRVQGDLAGALVAYRESLAVIQRLAATDPSNAVWQRDLSVSQGQMGDVLLARGDLAGALQAYRESHAILQRLASAHPFNLGWQRDLSISRSKLGDVLVAQRDLAGALLAYRQSLALSRRLASADPSNAGWQRDLSVTHERMGDVLSAQGDLAGALAAYRESLAIRQRLASANPCNAAWQRDLSLSQSNLGDVLSAQGDLAGALSAWRESLAVSQRLAAADPSNAVWQHDLSVSHERMGDLLLAQRRIKAAVRCYGERLAIARRLRRLDPTNAIWRSALFQSWLRLVIAWGSLWSVRLAVTAVSALWFSVGRFTAFPLSLVVSLAVALLLGVVGLGILMPKCIRSKIQGALRPRM
jgi:tetratricopeptide (TPR) repeat protein